MKFLKSILIFILLLGVTIEKSNSQSKIELEQKRKELARQIEIQEKLIAKTTESKKATLGDYQALKKQVSTREKLIRNIEEELDNSNTEIDQKRTTLDSIQNKITDLEEKYNRSLNQSYRQKLVQNKFINVLSSNSLKDAFLKWRYYRQFENYTISKANKLKLAAEKNEKILEELNQFQQKKEELLREETTQKSKLKSSMNQKNKMLDKLKRNEKLLVKDYEAQKAEREKISTIIANIIKSEAKKASSSSLPKTPEARKLAADFVANKGRLPWPVDKGIIILKYGKYQVPGHKNVYSNNDGIKIRSDKNAMARAIFDGEVSIIQKISGYNYAVVVKHGDFMTIYSNLQSIQVNKGPIKKGTPIGTLINKGSVSELDFQVWKIVENKNPQKQNPEDWLSKQ